MGGVPSANNNIGNMAYTFFVGAVAVQGTIWASTTQFGSTVSMSGRCSMFNCDLRGTVSFTNEANDNNTISLDTCLTNGITFNLSSTLGGSLCGIGASNTNLDSCTFNYSGVAINLFNLDAASAQSLWQHGATLTGTLSFVGPSTMAGKNGTGATNNIGSNLLTFKSPIQQIRANATLTLVTPGTDGNAVLNVIYTDTLGVSRTKSVTSALNIAGAAGDEVQGSLVFTQNGSTQFNYSVTGIVTPGALSYNYKITLEPAQ